MRTKDTEQKQLKRIADKLWSLAIRKRAGDRRCEWCGTNEGNQAHHIFSRRHLQIRHAVTNGVWLCGGCHMRAHQDPERCRDFLIERMGRKLYKQLYAFTALGKGRPIDFRTVIRGIWHEVEDMPEAMELIKGMTPREK